MTFNKIAVILAIVCQFPSVFGHHSHSHQGSLSPSERDHLALHSEESGNLNDVSEEELRFLYFKMHDSDSNNLLDGCELVKSLLHWHAEEQQTLEGRHGQQDSEEGAPRIFSNEELSMMVDPILDSDDVNQDGFIDYPEFVAAQVSRGM